MKTLKLTKIDRRHKGYGKFNYFVSVPFSHSLLLADREEIFCNWRIWCWNTWGPSCELAYHDGYKTYSSKNWCWETSEYGMRLYLADELEASAFSLQWL